MTDSYCFDTCTTACNSTEDGLLFQRNWYSVASGTTMFGMWAGYTGIYVIFCALFWYSRFIQPIKSRSPGMVLVSGFGGYLLATNFAMAHYVTGIQKWPCPFSHWALWFGYPLFLLPYPVRALNLYLIFKRNVNKVKNHAAEEEKVAARVTVVEHRFSMTSGSDGNNDIQGAIARHKAKKEQAKQDQKPGVSTIGEDPKGEEPKDGDKTVSFRLTEEQEKVPDRNVDRGWLFKKNQSVRSQSKLSKLGKLDSKFLGSVYFARYKGNAGWFEKHANKIFWLLILLCACIGMVRQYVFEDILGSGCVGCIVSFNAAVIQTIVVVIILAIQIFSSVFIKATQVKDQFRIGLELQLISFIWTLFLVPACVLAFTGIECDNLRTTCGSFDNFTSFCYYNFAAQHWLIYSCILISFLVTIFVPVIRTHLKGRKRLLNEGPKNLWPRFKALKSLKECLSDEETAEAFQKFCIQSFCVENVLFWHDAEKYKALTEFNEQRVRAVAIYRKYIDVSGNLFVDLPDYIQQDLDNKLSEAALREEDEEEYDYNFTVDSTTFEEAQQEIFQQMETEIFPQFLQSDDAKRLYTQYNRQFALVGSLREQRLI